MDNKKKKKVRVRTGDVVCVEWIDSSFEGGGWQSIREVNIDILAIRSYGVVVDIDDRFIALSANYGYDDMTEYTQVNSIMAIPNISIKTITHYSKSPLQGIKNKKEKTLTL
ncbi:MAG: hypothetical protein LBG17_04765 [Bacteroidales bacterium]|jgi:hypothetical protein|nr:hypothetical protein [Bacteroidales bacterium]